MRLCKYVIGQYSYLSNHKQQACVKYRIKIGHHLLNVEAKPISSYLWRERGNPDYPIILMDLNQSLDRVREYDPLSVSAHNVMEINKHLNSQVSIATAESLRKSFQVSSRGGNSYELFCMTSRYSLLKGLETISALIMAIKELAEYDYIGGNHRV